MISGIYCIRNILNNKTYIGSSKDIQNRKVDHFHRLNKNIHPNNHLQKSYNKYCKENFLFEIVEICSIDNLLIREQYYIDLLKPKYNIRQKAESNLGTKWSEEAKRKASIKQTKECRERWGISIICLHEDGILYCRFDSIAQAAEHFNTSTGNILQILKGQKKSYNKFIFIRESEYDKNKDYKVVRNYGKYLQKQVKMYDKTMNLMKIFQSPNEACKQMNIKRSTLSMCLIGKNKTAGGYIWKY